jgi:hypothetical protein
MFKNKKISDTFVEIMVHLLNQPRENFTADQLKKLDELKCFFDKYNPEIECSITIH